MVNPLREHDVPAYSPAPIPAPLISRRMVWLGAAGFWGVFGVLSGVQVWLSMLSHGHSLPRMLAYYVLTWELWLVPSLLIARLARRFPVVPPKVSHVLVHIGAVLIITLVHCLYGMALLLTIKPFDKMNPDPHSLKVVLNVLSCLPLQSALYCLVLGCTLAIDFYSRYRERALQAANLQASLSQARLRALELQIQPHFLFNTMNAISSLVKTQRNGEAMAMIGGLSELLRYTLDHEGHPQVPLDKELSVLQRYLEIQKVRFADRMDFAIEASTEARRATVPTLLLQPLAENAVRHGIAHHENGGEVKVRAWRMGQQLKLEVFNSGTLHATANPGIGLRNTLARMQHLYGDAWSFELGNVTHGVLATISIPWSESP